MTASYDKQCIEIKSMHPAADSKEIPNEVVWLLYVPDHILIVDEGIISC
jgi:hypothetical protein